MLLNKLLFVLVLSSTPARAHEVTPAIADLTAADGQVSFDIRLNIEAFLAGIDLDGLADTDEAQGSDTYDVLRAEDRDAIAARLAPLIDSWNALPLLAADGTPIALTQNSFQIVEDAGLENPRVSRLVLSGSLPSGTEMLSVNWPDGHGALALRQQGAADLLTVELEEGDTSAQILLIGEASATGWQTFADYIPIGFDHILPKGLDHILFVLGLFLLSTRLGRLIWQISAFTLAHTVTLALGALDIVTIQGNVVEPLIAASIVYVAIENIFATRLNVWRPVIVFGFGLLHGLGFASVLEEFGLPEAQFIPALLGFNVGVEIGQLTVIAMAFILLLLATRAARLADLDDAERVVVDQDVMFRAVSITGSLAIALIGIWWVIERTLL